MLADIALHADDHTGPVLDTNGTVRQAHGGYVPRLGDPKDRLGLKANLLGNRLFVFTATGWLTPVVGPEHDGAYQLNVHRLQRLLAVAEAEKPTPKPWSRWTASERSRLGCDLFLPADPAPARKPRRGEREHQRHQHAQVGISPVLAD